MRTRRGCHELSARRFRSVRATMASGIAMPSTPPTMAAASCDAGKRKDPRNRPAISPSSGKRYASAEALTIFCVGISTLHDRLPAPAHVPATVAVRNRPYNHDIFHNRWDGKTALPGFHPAPRLLRPHVPSFAHLAGVIPHSIPKRKASLSGSYTIPRLCAFETCFFLFCLTTGADDLHAFRGNAGVRFTQR